MINWGMFHFIRPMWLWALLLIPILIWLFAKRHSINSSWRHSVDLHLLTHLLVGNESRRRFLPVVALSVGLVVAVISMAGPSWSKLSQPVYQADITRMIVLDLSRSMDVPDVKPSRLTRAKFKVLDLLNKVKEGQVGLIVYADEPYVVSPLTEDSATIAAMVPTLITQLMPAQGSKLGLALSKVEQLFQQTGVKKGDVFVITDGLSGASVEDNALNIAKSLKDNGHRLSVLGVGTKEGAPIPLAEGGFFKDTAGGIVIPKFDAIRLKKLASEGGGIYSALSVDDADIDKFLSLSDATGFLNNKKNQQTTDIWRDQGFWLLFLLLPISLFVFRRGTLLVFCLVMILPVQKPSFAAGWDDLWLRKDQQAAKTMEENKYQEAAELFENEKWKGVAHYKANEFEKAIEQFSKINTPEANYNLGNALAKAGKIDDAIKAYQRVLETNAEHEDAKFNKVLLEKMQRDNQQNNQQNNQQDQQTEQSEKEQGDKQSGENSQNDNSQNNDSKNKQDSDNSEQAAASDDNKGQGGDEADKNSKSDEQTGENKSADSEKSKNQPDKDALQKAIEQANSGKANEKDDDKNNDKNNAQAKMTAEEQRDMIENSQAVEQWLSKIKDDPGGLLRQKFIMEHKRRRAMSQLPQSSSSGEQW